MNSLSLSNKKFGCLTALCKTDRKSKGGMIIWLFSCDCGSLKEIPGSQVSSGKFKSCGCSRSKNVQAGRSIYSVYSNMKTRCYNSKIKDFKNYGGRGIKVCDRWLKSFDFFFEDMFGGYKKGLQLDRIDNNGNYEPSNCRWATKKQNGRNTRSNHLITYNGKTQTSADWGDEIGLPYSIILNRIYRGWDIERALTTP